MKTSFAELVVALGDMFHSILHFTETMLNATYRLCGYLASLCIVTILLVVVINIYDRLTGGYTPGTNEIASYCVGAAGALGLAFAFGEGKHLKMTLLVSRTTGSVRKMIDLSCLLIGIGLSGFVTYFLAKMVYVSAVLEDRSTGMDEALLWIPQAPMAFGFFVLSLSMIHALATQLSGSQQ